MTKRNFEGISLNIQIGDIISSRLGILAQSPITKEWYIYFKAKYLGNGKIEVIGNKNICDVKRKD